MCAKAAGEETVVIKQKKIKESHLSFTHFLYYQRIQFPPIAFMDILWLLFTITHM